LMQTPSSETLIELPAVVDKIIRVDGTPRD
jgi:hypothetical protein